MTEREKKGRMWKRKSRSVKFQKSIENNMSVADNWSKIKAKLIIESSWSSWWELCSGEQSEVNSWQKRVWKCEGTKNLIVGNYENN